MSQRNKAPNKSLRRGARALHKSATEQTSNRHALSHIPRDVASRVLTDPKAKLTGKQRRRFARSFATVVIPPDMKKARDIAVKVCIKLGSLPLVGVTRLIKKSATRAASLKYMLEKLDPASKFRAPLQAQQDHFLAVLKQAQAEYLVRTTPR
ncbi:MAG: hypothetical protein HOO67_05545 [Candidatus Peribacteraceae bacterium]|nr:hypothetical protein [Candidatus Peribacteraceae bacterium]